MFSKKGTKIDKIFTDNLTLTTWCQIGGEDFVNFVAFLENMNFMKLANSDLMHLFEDRTKIDITSDIQPPFLSNDVTAFYNTQ